MILNRGEVSAHGSGVTSSPFQKPIVESFLERLRECIDRGDYIIEERGKNMAFLAHHGYTVEDQEEILKSLTFEDFIKSEHDRDDITGQDIYWFFKRNYDNQRVYVKYKIMFFDQWPGYAFVKSLHDDEP